MSLCTRRPSAQRRRLLNCSHGVLLVSCSSGTTDSKDDQSFDGNPISGRISLAPGIAPPTSNAMVWLVEAPATAEFQTIGCAATIDLPGVTWTSGVSFQG